MKVKCLIPIYFIWSLVGCVSDNAIKQSEEKAHTGVPYSLPKSVIEVELKLGDGAGEPRQNILLSTTAKQVPGRETIYLLDPESEHWLVSNDHHFVLENGLISSVDTTDSGEGGAVLENVTTSLINLAEAAIFAAQGATEEPFLHFQSYPTKAEIDAIAEMLAGRAAKVSFDPYKIPTGRVDVPGTHGLLYLTFNKARLPLPVAPNPYPRIPRPPGFGPIDTVDIESQCRQASKSKTTLKLFSSKLKGLQYSMLPGRPVWAPLTPTPAPAHSNAKNFVSGLYTRALQGFDLNTQLYVDLWRLREVRLEHMFEELKSTKDDLISVLHGKESVVRRRSLYGSCSNQNGRKKALEDRIEQLSVVALYQDGDAENKLLEARVAKLKSDLADIEKKEGQCKTTQLAEAANIDKIKSDCQRIAALVIEIDQVDTWRPQDDFLTARSDETLQVAILDPIRVPLRRATMGKTVNSVKFDRGILTNYRQTKPSEGKVLTESFMAVTSSIRDGVVSIAKIPAEAIGIEVNEVNAKTTLTDAQRVLVNQQDKLSGTQNEIRNVLLAAKLEQVKSDPTSFLESIDINDLLNPQSSSEGVAEEEDQAPNEGGDENQEAASTGEADAAP